MGMKLNRNSEMVPLSIISSHSEFASIISDISGSLLSTGKRNSKLLSDETASRNSSESLTEIFAPVTLDKSLLIFIKSLNFISIRRSWR